MMARALLVLALLMAGGSAVIARPADEPTRGGAPAWVEWLPIPEPSEERLSDVEDGRYALLTDTQVRHDGADAITFVRSAVLITDRAGLEKAAQKQIEFDPGREDLIFHRIAVWRGGRMIDATRTATVETLRRETELDNGIITGAKTALVRIADVRVGDVVDLATSWRARDPLWRGIYTANFSLGWSDPVGLTRVRLITPAAMALNIKQENAAPGAIKRTANGVTTREWRADDLDPVPDQERSPKWWRPWASVAVSTMRGWGEVVDWARPIYAGESALPAGYVASVDAIAARSSDPAVRTVAALRLVQDSIRYTSVSIGQGGYRPRTPAQTVANGFGDCKDKTQLLVATLRRLGVEAWPALTDTDEGPALTDVLPGPGAFDHVIVLARVAGRDHWLDATGSHQGGSLGNLAALHYGHALPIRAGQDRLHAIANPVPALPTMQTLDRYRRTADGVTFSTTTLFTYDEADIKRTAIAGSGLAKLQRDELTFFRTLYPAIRRRSRMQVVDDREANRLLVHQRYLLPATAKTFGKTLGEFEVQASTLRDIYKTVPAERGAAPITVPYTIHRTHRIVLDTPGYSPPRPAASTIDGPGFTMKLTSERDGDRLMLGYTLVGKGPLLAGDSAIAYADQVKKLNDETWWWLDLTSSDGGLIDGGPAAIGLAVAAGLLAVAWLVILGFAIARVHREVHDPEAPFVPMPAWRFALLGLASFGLYSSYWTWRHWRWARSSEGAKVLPFGRGLFSLLWAGPTFLSANRRAALPLPVWLGIGAAILLPLLVIATNIPDLFAVEWMDSNATILLQVAAEVSLMLPALLAVNRANGPARVAGSARLGPLAIVSLIVGALSWLIGFAIVLTD